MRSLLTRAAAWLRKRFPPHYPGGPVCFDLKAVDHVAIPLANHTGNVGDVIFSCLFLKSFWERTQKKVKLHLQTNVPVVYSVNHPLKNVLMNHTMAMQLVPLLLRQPYIADVSVGNAQPAQIHFDLTTFRQLPMSLRCGIIPGWQQLCSDLWLNVFDAWLTADKNAEHARRIVISRTMRLTSPYINYKFLADYRDRLLFLGLPEEYATFSKESSIECAHKTATDFFEAAVLVNSAALFIGNQGFLSSLAESLKAPRLLESNTIAPNNYPLSANGRVALFQQQFEAFAHEMLS